MKDKTLLVVVAIALGGCCVLGGGALLLVGALGLVSSGEHLAPVGSPSAPGEPRPTQPARGDEALGGYRLYGEVRPVAKGFEGLPGQWLYMDGATVESLDSITADTVRVTSNRSGELWHFTFEAGGSYVLRHVLAVNKLGLLTVEKGDWDSDGQRLTLTPTSCTTRSPHEKGDCDALERRSYQLTTVAFVELDLTFDKRELQTWQGVQLDGPMPSYGAGYHPLPSIALEPVR